MAREVVIRGVAVVVLAVAVLLIALVLLRGGDSYEVDARIINAGNLVNGNVVTVAGEPVGLLEEVELTDDGQARLRLSIDSAYAPLREGTRAIVRKRSLSSIAADTIELQLGPDGPALRKGDEIPAIDTESAVPFDAVLNTFDPIARLAVGKGFKLFRDFNLGKEDRSQAALLYLNPAIASGSRLFQELNASRPELERFIDSTAMLTTDLSSRDDQLAGLVTNLGTTLRALAAERGNLGDSLEQLPTFLRRTNTTFVNLRATLDDLDPLVTASKPVVRDKLRPLFAELRPFAADAAPTVRDLSKTIKRPGADNDLIELLNRQPAIDKIANQNAVRNGKDRPGAFKALQASAQGVTPQFEYFRPYTPELAGWFDDFSSSGGYDALGGFSRAGLGLNGFAVAPLVGDLLPIPPALRDELLTTLLTGGVLDAGRNNRCPGSLERGAIFRPTPDFNCDPTSVPIGR